jgi:two-component sensor histidine kinase/ligand-binding sensor domain-containing protein
MRLMPIILPVILCANTGTAQLQQPVYIGNLSWSKAVCKSEPTPLPVTPHKIWMTRTVYPNESTRFRQGKIDPQTKVLHTGRTLPAAAAVTYKAAPLPVPEITEAAPLLTRDNADFNVNYTDKQHGFAGSNTQDIAEDANHHIWIASEAGLIRYDGYHYYKYATNTQFPVKEVNSLLFDSRQRLWMGTSTGLYYIQHDSIYTVASRDVDFRGLYCFKVQQDKQHRIWVSTKQSGALCIADQRMQVYDTRCGLPNNYAFNTFIDSRDNIYIALWDRGIVIIKPEKMVNMFASMPGPTVGISMIRSFTEDEKGIWMGTYTNGLLCMQAKDTLQYTFNGRFTDRIFDIKKAPQGLSLSIYGSGLTYFSDKDLFSIGEANGLVGRNAYYMMQDSFGNLWVTDLYSGFSRLNENLIYQRALPNKHYMHIEKAVRDQNNGSWLFTSGTGLWYLHDTVATKYMNDLANGVAGIYYPKEGMLEEDGSIWMVGYDGEGIMHGKGQDFVCYKYTDFKEHAIILSMKKDRDKKLWFSTMNYGVISYDNNVFRHYTDSSGLRNMAPVKLFLDAENKVCCSFSNGFQRFSDHGIENMQLNNRLFDKQVNDLFVKDAQNTIMAVANEGLFVVHDKEVYQLTTQQGLGTNNINSIVSDASGRIWVTTDKGIEYFVFNGPELKDHQRFDQSNGAYVPTAGNAIIDEAGNPYWTNGDKKLVFNPLFRNTQHTALVFSITQIQVDKTQLQPGERIAALPDQKININFTAIYWGRENFLNIKYLLISGHGDTTVRSVENMGNILISDVQPDDYRVVLMAKDNDKTFYAEPIRVQVNNFWYNTWLFRLLLLGLVVAGIIVYFRQKAARQRAMNKELKRKVAEQTAVILREKEELVKSNRIIDEQVREKDVLIQEINHRVKNNLQFMTAMVEMQIRASAKKDTTDSLQETNRRITAMSLVHEMLYDNTKKVQGLSVKKYITELVDNLKEMASGKERPISINIDVADIFMDSRSAVSLGMIISELVSNSFKHAFAGVEYPEVYIELIPLDDGYLQLTVRDNGKGIKNENAAGTGLGRKFVDIFSRQLDGTYSMQTAGQFIYTLRFKIFET